MLFYQKTENRDPEIKLRTQQGPESLKGTLLDTVELVKGSASNTMVLQSFPTTYCWKELGWAAANKEEANLEKTEENMVGLNEQGTKTNTSHLQ